MSTPGPLLMDGRCPDHETPLPRSVAARASPNHPESDDARRSALVLEERTDEQKTRRTAGVTDTVVECMVRRV